MASAGSSGQQAARAAQQAADSKWIERTARVGLAARGLVYVLIGILALQIAFVDRAERADQQGAFQTLAQNGFGKAILWLVIIGFVGYGLWQATEAAWGHRRERDDGKRTASRVESAVKAAIYLILAVVAFRVVTGTSRSGQGGEQVTAEVLQFPGGQILVALTGVVIVAAAVLLTWRGLRTRFEEYLDLSELGPRARSAVINLGKVGYVARGIVFTLVGILVVAAAVTFDPDKARGMDAALRQVAARPYGPWLLGLMALGLMCFGAYSFAESRYRRL
jgi:small-conductance mechanosensitive channel